MKKGLLTLALILACASYASAEDGTQPTNDQRIKALEVNQAALNEEFAKQLAVTNAKIDQVAANLKALSDKVDALAGTRAVADSQMVMQQPMQRVVMSSMSSGYGMSSMSGGCSSGSCGSGGGRGGLLARMRGR